MPNNFDLTEIDMVCELGKCRRFDRDWIKMELLKIGKSDLLGT